MNNFSEPKNENASEKLQVWCCEHCKAVHFKAGNILLNFTRTEFADLARAVMEIYQQEFGGSEFYRLINLINQSEDDVLLSRTIA